MHVSGKPRKTCWPNLLEWRNKVQLSTGGIVSDTAVVLNKVSGKGEGGAELTNNVTHSGYT